MTTLAPPDALPAPPAEPAGPITRRRASPLWMRALVLAAIVVAALAVRHHFLDVETMDYRAFLSRWYDTLDQQGFAAFRQQFADYNYPYLYLIWLLTVANVPSLIGIKALSIVFDFVLGFFAYRIVALKTERFSLRALAFGVVVLLPSVIANSAVWGQADGIYSALALGGIYFLLRAARPGIAQSSYTRNSVWACVFFGLALAFKLQAVFVLPVLLWLLLRRRLPWYALLAIPAVFVAAVVPAVCVGAPWSEALLVYKNQTGSYKQLTLGAANLYQLIPISGDATWLAHLGIGLAGAIVVAFLVWSVWRTPPVTAQTILAVATASAVIVPFLLPAMHERYFYTAEILSVVLAFYLPLRFVLIPILVQVAAIGVYHESLSGDQGMGGAPGGGGPFGGSGGGDRAPGAPTAGGGPGGPGGGGNGGGPGGGGPGGGSGGGPAGGGPGGGSGSYSSGRGDTALSVYASMMGLAALTLIYAVGDSIRRARGILRH
ncbi:MAG: hypothetical protein QM662_06160 [Gordonia sp. (in: high G+C Gram-positive bacteria)]